MVAIAGAIALFVQMGQALPKGGPAGLFNAFLIWGIIMWAVNECFAEMVTYLPIPSPFVRFGSEWVDDALGFAMAWNFFLNEAFLVPFEIVAMNVMTTFWTDKVPVEAIIVVMIVLYALFNMISIRCMTVTGSDTGAFVEHLASGETGRFLGILSCLYQASFSICGPEYISIVAAEAENPRKVLPPAIRSVVWRMLVFFVGSALCMGIVIPYNGPTLALILGGDVSGSGTGAASPYVISMERLKIFGLPHLVNALIMTSIFSAGNGLLFTSTRTLYGMSLTGHAPPFFSTCTKGGVPIFALIFTLSFCLLAFLQVNSSSAEVMTYLVDLVTCCQLMNYGFTALTYRHFFSALSKQGISRDTLPYKGRFQPYTSYLAMGGTSFMILAGGYDLFLEGGWSVMWFFLDYGMIGFFIVAFLGWKLVFRTKYVRPETADLSLGGLKEEIDNYDTIYGTDLPRKSGFLNRFFN
ncbi:amino acid permease [Penicillium longicatenatum]|uniref:amino acid permease n=1 Tax=Penicillium longicatenatum TaxID=1561947 RepID=UPI002546829E|nr:amino acid permease [Penicillium longicatenatum]KAJ5650429.1 amino acid permease [Penicillium longicatenatum]